MLCPRCQTPLERDDGVAYCVTCGSSLQSPRHVAIALGLAVDDRRNEPSFVHPRQAVASCPVCEIGTLAEARVWAEPVICCENCKAWWLGAGTLSVLRGRVARENAQAAPTLPRDAPFDPIGYGAGDKFEYDTLPVNQLAIPAAFGIGLLAQLLGFDVLVYATVGMWTHELGHAVISWLSGMIALPLPFFTAMPSEGRSFLAIAVAWGASAALTVYAARHRSLSLRVVGLLLVLSAVFLTAVLSEREAQQWILLAGLGGEIVLSAALILAFYEVFPGRWDFWRYPMLVAGAIALVHSTWTWLSIVAGRGRMPSGAAVGRATDGDVERLERLYGWTETRLVHAYMATVVVAYAVILSAYIAGVLRAAKLQRAR